MDDVKKIKETLMNEKRGIRIELENGKYTFYSREDGSEVGCLRFGEPWVVFDRGSKALVSLLSLLSEKEKKIEELDKSITIKTLENAKGAQVLSDVEAQLKQETISVNELSLANQDLEAQFNALKELLGEHSIEMTVVKLKARIKSLESELSKWTAPHEDGDLQEMKEQSKQASLSAKQAYINALEYTIKHRDKKVDELDVLRCKTEEEWNNLWIRIKSLEEGIEELIAYGVPKHIEDGLYDLIKGGKNDPI